MPDDPRTGQPVPGPVFDPAPADEVADEFRFHHDMYVRDLVARGHAATEARRLAAERLREFDCAIDECRHLAEQREGTVRRTRYIVNLVQDVRFGLRLLRQRPLFAVMAILPLALGIGAATAMYSVVDGVMLRPLPFPHPEQLVAIWATEEHWKNEKASAIAWNSVVIGQADYIALRDRARTLSAVGAWEPTGGTLGNSAGTSENIDGVLVSSSIFKVLGIRPVIGRLFQSGDDVRAGPHVVILGWETWQRRFGGDSGIVGRSVTFNDVAYTVIGVMPAKVRLDRSVPSPGIWFPAFQDREDEPDHHNRSYRGLGRLAPGATLAQANAEIGGIVADVKAAWKGTPDGTSARVSNWQEDQVGSVRASLLILAGAVGLLLLIACVNVATLMFGEAARRQPEIAARVALGATPARLARQLLTESIVISGVGATLGLVLGWALTHALVALAPGKVPGLTDVRVDGRVLIFTAACALFTGIAFGVLPAFALLRWGRHSTVRVGSGQTRRGENRIQRVLVATEVSLSLVMLVGCSLLGRSLVRLSEVDPGFAPAGLIMARVSAPARLWSDSAATVSYVATAVRELKAIPGVASVSGSNSGLFSGNGSSSPIKVVGRPAEPFDRSVQQRVVLADYFRTMHVPIASGRDFQPLDNASSEPVAIISLAEARRDFAGQSPLGQRVVWQGKEWTVIGVAADVHYTGLASDFQPTIYIPEAQRSGNWVSYLIRASGTSDGSELVRVIRERLAMIDPTAAVSAVDAVPTLVEHSYAEERYRTLLGSLFGIMGSVLVGIGIFGVISRTVAQRLREAGIRVALGAQERSLIALMLHDTIRGAAVGVVAGIGLAALLARALTPYLFGVRAGDPAAYLVAFALLAITMIAATVPPARRAARVDPATILRAE